MVNPDWTFTKSDGERVERMPGIPTPCGSCPKKSPENAERLKLTTRSRATIERYHQVMASGGQCLSKQEKQDPWLMAMLAIVGRELKEFERQDQVMMLGKFLGAVQA